MPRPAVPPAPPVGWGPRPAGATTIILGPVTLDVADEAAVIGRLGGPSGVGAGRAGDGLDLGGLCRSAEAVVAAGAAAVELPVPSGADPGEVGAVVAALADHVGVPVLVAAGDAAPLEAALAAGAAAGVVTAPTPDAHLAAVAAAGASLLVPGDGSPGAGAGVRAAGLAAIAAGIAVERVLLDVGVAHGDRDGWPGLPVLVSEPPAVDGAGDRSAALALGIALGGRLLRTTDPRGARRTSVALAAILQERQEGTPG